MLNDQTLAQLKISHFFLGRVLPFLRWFESDKPRAPFVADKLGEVHRTLMTPPTFNEAIEMIRPLSMTPSIEKLIADVHVRCLKKWDKHFSLVISEQIASRELVRFWYVAKLLNPCKKGARMLATEEIVGVMESFFPVGSNHAFGSFSQSAFFFCLTHRAEFRKSLEYYFLDNFGTRIFDTGEDVWRFWVDERSSHPELATVALSMLSVPTSSSAVERSFKQAKSIGFHVNRQTLSPEKVRNLHKIRYNGSLQLENCEGFSYFE